MCLIRPCRLSVGSLQKYSYGRERERVRQAAAIVVVCVYKAQ